MKYLSILAVIVIVSIVHEFGHAIAMLKNNLEIEEIGLGLPLIPIRLGIQLPSFNFFGLKGRNLKISFYPLFLIGAFVRLTGRSKELMERLPAGRQIQIFWAGPSVNLFFPLLLGAVIRLLKFNVDLTFLNIFLIGAAMIMLPYILSQGSKTQRRMATFLPLFYVLIILGAFMWFFLTSGERVEFVGPVGIVAEFPRQFPGFISQLCLISLSLFLINMFPVPPLDGGKILIVFLREVGVPETVLVILNVLGTLALFILMMIVIVKDIFRFVL